MRRVASVPTSSPPCRTTRRRWRFRASLRPCRAIQIRPGNATWYAHLSSLCRSTYRMEEALATGQESIRLDPNNPEHLVNLSLIFVDIDDRERAMACLLRALGLKHDRADGHLAMAQNLLAMGE